LWDNDLNIVICTQKIIAKTAINEFPYTLPADVLFDVTEELHLPGGRSFRYKLPKGIRRKHVNTITNLAENLILSV
jgi:hypothetical protein